MQITRSVFLLSLFVLMDRACAWSVRPWHSRYSIDARPLHHRRARYQTKLSANSDKESQVDLEWLKRELSEYLKKREEIGADELAKQTVGKVIGGTRKNPVLDYVSLSPNKEGVIEAPPNPFDYDELIKYGYSPLVSPIMKAGGRIAMYKLMGMEVPPSTSKPKPVSAPKLVIDRTGASDAARYSGLKLGQILDDDAQAAALAEAQLKQKKGQELRPKLQEELFERPFADKRNISPKQTPDWTPEKLDEWGKQQGKAIAWARKARDGEFVSDAMETLDLDFSQRFYSVVAVLLPTIVFGKSTPTCLAKLDAEIFSTVLDPLQIPAAALLLCAVGSGVFCAAQAGERNRNQIVWFIKGILGGPLSIQQLRSSASLLTQGETSDAAKGD